VGAVKRAATIFIILAVASPFIYLGLLYFSAVSAKYSISRVNLLNAPDPVRAILSRQLDIDLYLSIEGHGPLSVPVKSLSGQVYLEDKYVGDIRSAEPFKIPASGTAAIHLTFHLDLSGISASYIQHIVDSISSHGGEVKIGFDGIIEPVILFFPVTIPVSYQFYALTSSNAPEVIDLSWDTTTATVGEAVGFHVTVRNIFRGSTIDGVLTLVVREDVALGFDVDAETFHFAVHLSPGESRTFSGSFKPYKRPSTRGFFLKAQWGDAVLAEQENKYPPRLSVVEAVLSIIDAYWT
jgi:LEA14-like dessication related protein